MIAVYVLGGLLLALFWIAVIVFLAGTPFVAWIAWLRGRSLRLRVIELEAEVARLRAGPDAPDLPVPEVAPDEPTAPEPADESPPPAPRPARLEGLFGRQVLGWAAVVMVVLAAAYFLQFAFANGWVGPFGQVSLGVVGGAALCLWGSAAMRRGSRAGGQMLAAAGAVILYLSVFAGFGYYDLLPPTRGALYLSAVVAATLGLAVAHRAPGIAYVALAGGLATPLLLPPGVDQYWSLFAFLLLLDAGMLAASLARGWRLLAPLSLVGVQCLFHVWFEVHFHPEKLAACLAFQGLLLLLHGGHDVLAPALSRGRAHAGQIVGVSLAGVFAASAAVRLLERDHWLALAPLAAAAAVAYACGAWLTRRLSPGDGPLRLTLVACGLGLVAVALALRFDGHWASAGWAVQGLALWWFGLRLRSDPLRAMAAFLFVLAFGLQVALLTSAVEPRWPYRGDLFVPVFNGAAVSGLVVAGCLLAAAWRSRVTLDGWPTGERAMWLAGVLGGVGLGWLVLTADVWRYCRLLDDGYFLAGAAISVLWAAYAGLVLAIGFWRDSPTVRYVGLGLFAVAMLKAIFVDTASLHGGYRVVAFFVLAAIMAAAAFGYQRLDPSRVDGSRKGVA